jgi:hypothetical protein
MKILKMITVFVNAVLALFHLTEWVKVGYLKKIENYPFGSERPSPYYYQSAELYAQVMQIWGLVFLVLLALSIGNLWIKNKILSYIVLAILAIFLALFVVHISVA